LFGSVLIYFQAGDEPGYGDAYYLAPEDSKRAVREMQEFGGGINVLVYKLGVWFDGLWHGKSLAYTIAVITVLLAYGFRLASDLATSETDSGKGENNKEKREDKKS
jgi:hypothetical protein